MSKLVRIHPYNPKRGFKLRSYTLRGMKFLETHGWYQVADTLADYLETVPSDYGDPDSPPGFDICTQEEAIDIDEDERQEALKAVATRPYRTTPARATERATRELPKEGPAPIPPRPAEEVTESIPEVSNPVKKPKRAYKRRAKRSTTR